VAALTVGEAWADYLIERRPHWGELHAKDHARLSKAGGEPSKRGTRGRGVTVAGPIYPLLALALRDLNAAKVEAWAASEAKTRPTSARLAWRLLKVFLGWCAEQPAYAGLLPPVNPAKTKRSREAFGKAGVKQDALLREQLPAWFAAVRAIGNPVAAAYLQTLLLTGARPGEVLAMRWEDVNLQWRGLTIRDKVEGERVIPLTPYVSQLLAALPRRSASVFSSPSTDAPMSKPHKAHSTACSVAGIEGLTLHGLRRSFKSLTEWLEIPAGVVAQIMGHKPSATAEKHYTVRPLDLLRLHHEKIEAWILEQAGVRFVAGVEPGKLALVS
jgi:integrase